MRMYTQLWYSGLPDFCKAAHVVFRRRYHGVTTVTVVVLRLFSAQARTWSLVPQFGLFPFHFIFLKHSHNHSRVVCIHLNPWTLHGCPFSISAGRTQSVLLAESVDPALYNVISWLEEFIITKINFSSNIWVKWEIGCLKFCEKYLS